VKPILSLVYFIHAESKKLSDFSGIFLDQNLFYIFFKLRKNSHFLRKFHEFQGIFLNKKNFPNISQSKQFWKFHEFQGKLLLLRSIGKTICIKKNSIFGENYVDENSVGQNFRRSKFCRSKFLSVKILSVKILSVKILVGQNSVGQMYQNRLVWENWNFFVDFHFLGLSMNK
jgi:hypothetical protein